MQGYKLRMREELERRYGELRRESIDIANEMLRTPGIKISLVNEASFAEFRRWECHPNRVVDWNWPASWQSWKLHYPKRFECATWNGGRLIGFALGNRLMLRQVCAWIMLKSRPKPMKNI